MQAVRWIFLLTGLVMAGIADAGTVRIATWNIEHLRAENQQGAVKRDDADYVKLAELAAELDADIIALQEVDGPEAAARVFDDSEYNFFFSDRNNTQRTGFAVRNDITVTSDLDFIELSIDDTLRRGTDITVDIDGQPLRLLSVHLKSGCFDRPLSSSSNACEKLERQVPLLESWIDDRTIEGIPFVVLGDYNRRFDTPGDDFFPDIDDAAPPGLDLVRVTDGRTSDCLDGRFPLYIDHIVLDEQSAPFVVPASFRQVLITQDDMDEFALSDHCPISVDLALAGVPVDDPAVRAEELFNEIRALVNQTNEKVEELAELVPQLKEDS